ncbi:YhgE/Pip domain-containing protein [Halobacillus rhizosphaerae]|uniref:YhgE/Pip family protein n=1 Tax=Halobacillus rhizosphaerae TaxID=3064889 RepID=UPI00398A529F
MNGFKLWLSELKNLKNNKKLLIPFMAVLLIPLIYSGVFLWAFWNPYGNLDHLPVAIVNSDEGATYNKEPLDVGDEFVDHLKDDGDFEYHVVSKQEGYKGLKDKKYYMLVEIPQDFSSRATTILDEKPKKLQLKYVVNEGENYVSSRISDSALDQMKAKLSDEMTETYADAMFDQFNDLKTGLTDASTKASDLEDGAKNVDEGAAALRDKLKTFTNKQLELASGSQSLRNGAAEVARGSQKLNQGLGSLNNGFDKLLNGASQSKQGAVQLKQGLGKSKQGAARLEESLNQLVQNSAGLKQGTAALGNSLNTLNNASSTINSSASGLSADISELKDELAPVLAELPEEKQQGILDQLKNLSERSSQIEGTSSKINKGTEQLGQTVAAIPEQVNKLTGVQQQIKQGASDLSEGQDHLYSGANKLVEGQNQLISGMKTFGGKLANAKSGAADLASGAKQVDEGAGEIFNGSNQLADGSQKLQQGASDLSNGTNKLNSGTNEFQNNLSEASDQANSVVTSDRTKEMMAKPVNVDKNSVSKVPNYGTGFTPYFLSLGLFVGALLITIVFPVHEPLSVPKNAMSWFMSKFGVLVAAGVIQAVIVSSVILFGLNLEVSSVPYFYMFSILTSLTFMALIQMLVTPLGNPGRFIGILILILQLTTSAGTFPLELIPAPLQVFHSFLPMTYSIDGFRAIISEGAFHTMWQDAGTLGLYLLGFALVTIGYLMIKFRKKYSNELKQTA